MLLNVMDTFVDREISLGYISEAFDALLDKKRLLRTPILDFYGVGGIGKTFFLKKVQQRCSDKQLRCVWIDASQNVSTISREIVRQVQVYGIAPPFEESDTNLLYESISALRILLKRGSVAVLFDDVDTSHITEQYWLETLLRELSDANNILIVLTSKRKISFEHERSLASKLTAHPLPLFASSDCETYLNAVGNQSVSEVRQLLFVWSHGYPLVLDVMVQAINSGLDLLNGQDQKGILAQVTEQVVLKNVLKNVDPSEHDWYQILLSLLSVPRHFNLVIMQDLIEKFTPDRQRANSLEYFGLPREIIQTTEVLNWSSAGAGYSVSAPVRKLFLLKLQMEQLDTYYAVHNFLAQIYWQWAGDETGADRIRYLCEYLYHGVSGEQDAVFERFLSGIIPDIAGLYPESFPQFAAEVAQDNDLTELFGSNLRSVESLMHKNLVSIYRNLAAKSSGSERIKNLHHVFDHMMSDPDVNDLSLLLQQTIQQVMQQESAEITFKLYQELTRDERFQRALGDDFQTLSVLIQTDYKPEG